ncbi:hypothetical protein SKAU_G00419870 [Synaphobranchus kaupii]|uniref:Protein archease n=1 Tax=Synaphobranchus kaupii TaxID=118154 RepID=A0A9Q1IB11_SYNKA|nr:hypothetical protein SKAU_G00419870 [Synaphobranchus kaupii]
MDDRELDLTEAQKARKAKYPPINKKYEYLDHTADVQLHSWGDSMEEAFEQVAMAMFGYMTDTETVEPTDTVEVESEGSRPSLCRNFREISKAAGVKSDSGGGRGDDWESLLFHFLNDWLFKFSADLFFVPREVKVLHIDRMHYRIRSIGWGEEFKITKHPQGTEVKAITYSAMQIHDKEKPEIFVIIDI